MRIWIPINRSLSILTFDNKCIFNWILKEFFNINAPNFIIPMNLNWRRKILRLTAHSENQTSKKTESSVQKCHYFVWMCFSNFESKVKLEQTKQIQRTIHRLMCISLSLKALALNVHKLQSLDNFPSISHNNA